MKLTLQSIGHWTPAAFCAFISFTALSESGSPDAGWWKPAFFSFLPMCFVFVGSATWQMQKELRESRKQLTDLQAKQTRARVVA
jgi:hypothetical protein